MNKTWVDTGYNRAMMSEKLIPTIQNKTASPSPTRVFCFSCTKHSSDCGFTRMFYWFWIHSIFFFCLTVQVDFRKFIKMDWNLHLPGRNHPVTTVGFMDAPFYSALSYSWLLIWRLWTVSLWAFTLNLYVCVCVWGDPANVLEPARLSLFLQPPDLSEGAQSAKGQLKCQTSTSVQTVHREERGRYLEN